MSRTILVVDDEPNYLVLVKRFLKNPDHRVLTAEGGPAVMALLKTETIDLLLTDMRMSPMDGLDVVLEVRKKAPQVPVIIMTGYAIEGRLQQAMDLSNVTYLAKPFNMYDLDQIIKNILKE